MNTWFQIGKKKGEGPVREKNREALCTEEQTSEGQLSGSRK
jgi:hypothetical protein